MEELVAARYNIYWYLSFVLPACIMLAASFRHQRKALVAGVVFSLVLTYALCNIAVQTKWDTRLKLAETEEELAYATTDGANVVFTFLFIAPFEAVLYTTIWGFIGWYGWPRVKQLNATETQSGSRGCLAPSPHTTTACGSAPGGSRKRSTR